MNKNIVEYKNKNTLKIFWVYLYAFIIIYMPPISELVFKVPIQFFLGLLLCITIVPYTLRNLNKFKTITFNKDILFLILGIVISSVYFAFRARIGSNETRLYQNLFIIVQILHLIVIIDILKKSGYQKDNLVKFLLNLGLIQGIICISMICIPEFRNLALTLYHINGKDNMFISRNRIYGISGDYTFFTPIFHGMLAILASIYAVIKSYKFLVYVPFLLIAILLNGRFGLIIFVVGTSFAFLVIFLRGKSLLKVIFYTFIFIFFLFSTIDIIRITAPYTYSWIMRGVEDSINFFVHDKVQGNYEQLTGSFLFFPKGWGFFFGEGYRVYGSEGPLKGHNSSDIGYVNDMFMGGIIYVSILYGSIFRFLFNKRKKNIAQNNNSFYTNLISSILVVVLLLANYKGEVMRSGSVLLGVIFIKLILKVTEKQQ